MLSCCKVIVICNIIQLLPPCHKAGRVYVSDEIASCAWQQPNPSTSIRTIFTDAKCSRFMILVVKVESVSPSTQARLRASSSEYSASFQPLKALLLFYDRSLCHLRSLQCTDSLAHFTFFVGCLYFLQG